MVCVAPRCGAGWEVVVPSGARALGGGGWAVCVGGVEETVWEGGCGGVAGCGGGGGGGDACGPPPPATSPQLAAAPSCPPPPPPPLPPSRSTPIQRPLSAGCCLHVFPGSTCCCCSVHLRATERDSRPDLPTARLPPICLLPSLLCFSFPVGTALPPPARVSRPRPLYCVFCVCPLCVFCVRVLCLCGPLCVCSPFIACPCTRW